MRYKKRYYLVLAINRNNYEELKEEINKSLNKLGLLTNLKSGFQFIDDLARNSKSGILFTIKVYNAYKNEILFGISMIKGIITLLSSGNIKKIKQRINYGIDRRHNGV
jgi:hypothetical protein